MFWDLPDDPRGALRWSLSKLRQIMNNGGRDCLVADRNSVLVRGREIVLDLRRFKTVATRDVATVATPELEDAATLLRGGFLDDLSLPRCPEFEAWRTGWRESRRGRSPTRMPCRRCIPGTARLRSR
jgi:DNA-binding SARP family transcriptional activator